MLLHPSPKKQLILLPEKQLLLLPEKQLLLLPEKQLILLPKKQLLLLPEKQLILLPEKQLILLPEKQPRPKYISKNMELTHILFSLRGFGHHQHRIQKLLLQLLSV